MEPPALARTTSPSDLFTELLSNPDDAEQMQEYLTDQLTRYAQACLKDRGVLQVGICCLPVCGAGHPAHISVPVNVTKRTYI